MRNFKEARQKLVEKLVLTAAAGGIAFGGMFGAEKAGAQDGGDKKTPDDSLAQVVPNGAFDEANHIKMVEDPGEVPPVGEEELGVGERFYLGSIDQEVTVTYADRYMRLLSPDKMGGDPNFYQPVNRVEINPEYTMEMREEKIWSFYWPQVYLDLIQNGRETQHGRPYAEALGLQGSVTRETIWEALQKIEGDWPWIPYRYKWGSNGREDLYSEGYANPNLPIDITPLPRNLTPSALSTEPVKGWINIGSYSPDLVAPNSAAGVLVDKDTGQIRLYSIFHDENNFSIALLLYRSEAVFTTLNGIRPEPRGQYEQWYFTWWEEHLKGSPNDILVY